MKLMEFYAETRGDLERFAIEWKRNNATRPEEYPSDLPAGDWLEQFLMFLNTRDEAEIEGTLRRPPCVPKTYIEECLSYDPVSGNLTWRVRPVRHFVSEHVQKIFNSGYAGKVVKSGGPKGYVRINLTHNGVTAKLLGHRVAWLLQTGEWPLGQIDHIDGNRANNAWGNLRESSAQENARNTKARKHNRTGFKWAKLRTDGRFESRATVNGRTVYFGTFDTPQEASEFAAQRLASLHGEFINTGSCA